MTGHSIVEIIRVVDMEASLWIFENMNPNSTLAPAVGFEPTTNRLTADRSTTELRWIGFGNAEHTLASPFVQSKRRCGTKERLRNWLRGLDLNQRPSGYEPDELPGCSTPRA